MNWKLNLIILSILITTISCSDDIDEGRAASSDNHSDATIAQKEISHYNIVMVPDLSNRIDKNVYPRQLDDSSVYNVVLRLIPTLLSDHGRLAMQKDKFSMRLLNPLDVLNFNKLQPNLTIDLGKFRTDQIGRVDYINNKGNVTLNGDIAKFKAATNIIYEEAVKKGYTADLWGFFNQSLNSNYFKLTNPNNHPNAKTKDVSKNILIIITDGYIDIKNQEKNACKEKVCKWLNAEQVDKFRNYYKQQDKGKDLKEVFINSGYGLTPVSNNYLSDVEVLLVEVYDRSKNSSGRITKEPSDYEILKLFWTDFFEKSGAKKFRIVETCSSEAELEGFISSFIRTK